MSSLVKELERSNTIERRRLMEQVDENPEFRDSPNIGSFNQFVNEDDLLRIKYPMEDVEVRVAECSDIISQVG